MIELRNDILTNGCVAGGVECCDLTAQTVPRRLHSSGRVFLERIHFVKHYNTNALDKFGRDQSALTVYRQLVRSVIATGLARWHDSGIMDKLTNGALLNEAYESSKSYRSATIDQDLLQKHLEDSKSVVMMDTHFEMF